ncbi:MAG: penicillin-binding protein 2 [Pseudonocardia sp.]|nr:penicillin-binding protein 2 [Pseudonocardia sp.]
MNAPIRRVATAVMAMTVLLVANLTYVQVIKADDYADDPRNQRVLLAEYSRERGQISADGQVLARSVPSDGRYPYVREYPTGPTFASITGYYSSIYGTSGIERAANDVLNGSDPRLFTRRLSDLITGRDSSGGNVVTTIDPVVQQTAYDELASNGYTGAVVALRPDTGAILALASTPSYDPNPLASPSARVQQEAWAEYTSAEPPVLVNRTIEERYPPGSTFKLVIAAAALESGRYTPETQVTAASSITLADTTTTLQNFNGNQCGTGQTASLRDALQRSCNTAFAEIGADLGEEAVRDQAEAFGIGTEELTIPMPVAPSTIGDIESTAALQQSAIGQRDVALTPMQNAVIVATIANDGQLMAPHLIEEIQGQDLETIDTTAPDQLGRAVSPEVANTLTELMVNNENSYSGSGKIRGVQIAAKTGTAEHGTMPKQTAPHVWYVAFAPAANPQVAVAVLVESGGDRDNLAATGGEIAAPIGRAVIGAALRGTQ